MALKRWKTIEGAFFAVLTISFGAFVVRMDAEPTVVFSVAGTLLLIYFGVDVQEVELARRLTITFRNEERRDDEE